MRRHLRGLTSLNTSAVVLVLCINNHKHELNYIYFNAIAKATLQLRVSKCCSYSILSCFQTDIIYMVSVTARNMKGRFKNVG